MQTTTIYTFVFACILIKLAWLIEGTLLCSTFAPRKSAEATPDFNFTGIFKKKLNKKTLNSWRLTAANNIS